jgi:hypothetical protein
MRWLPLFVASLVLWAPLFVGAQGLVPVQCQNPQTCGTCEFVQLINNVIRFLITFASIAATLLIIYGGFQLVVSAGNVSAKQSAKEILTNTLIGYVIILAAFLIINTGLGVLLPGGSPALGWQRVQCLYPVQPVSRPYPEYGADGFIGFSDVQQGSGSIGSCEIDTSGPCSESALRAAGFGALAGDAARIVGAESGCSPSAHSRTDTTTDGRTTSVGTWQIHMPAHQVNCGGQTLDCPSAFVSSGQRNQYNVRTYEVTNEALYQRCVQALENPACNNQIAARLATRSGDMGDWACSARRCGVATTRNHLCPL